MSGRDLPEFERLPRPRLPDPRAASVHAAPRRRFNRFLVLGIPIFAMVSLYASLVVVTALDDVFLPGNELGIGPFAYIPGVENNKNPEFASEEERINVVVLGLDLRRDEPDSQAARTDSVMILTIDPFSKVAGVFSIPRDTWVEIPDGYGGYTMNRINVAYELGEYSYQDYPGGGAGLVKDTIKHNFGIDIDNYVVLNFNNFIDLIDELGGIEVNVPEYAYDFAYNDCNACPYYPVEFFPGPQHMDGETALAYARIRKSDNDFKRMERQQIVLRAVAKKAASLDSVLSNPINLYREYKSSVRTDISEFKVPGLAALMRQIDLDNVPMVSMAPATYACPATECGGAAALLWDQLKVEELKNQVFSPEAANPVVREFAIVSVKNGTLTPDLASEFAQFLSAEGIPSTQITIDEYYDGLLANETAIYDLSGKNLTSRQLADWLGVPYSRIHSADHPDSGRFIDEAGTTDVVVVLGADADVPGSAASNSVLPETETAGG